MSAEWELRQALLHALRSDGGIMARVNGVFDEGPITATAPFIELLSSIAVDWSSKSFDGREIRISIALYSAAQENAPDVSAIELIDQCVQNLPAKLASYTIINRQYIRSRTGHDSDGRWSILIDYRFRLQKI